MSQERTAAEALLAQNHALLQAMGEALEALKLDDGPGQACPTCRGVASHFAGCKIAMAVNVIENALAGVASA